MSNFQSKYKVLQKIGEGSFSEVLKCQNRETGECFAAKRLKKSYKSNEGVLNCAEIIAAQKIPYHQNVLNLLEFHYENLTGKAIFIFELMDMSMYDLLKNRTRRLPETRVKFFLYQILKGLTHLHNHGLFHRDVKPENILIKMTTSGELIKLADLGSVRGIYSEPPYTEYISTRWYRSPECLLTVGNYGPKMDVWATGCVFYEMLTLKPLFPGSNELDQLHKIHAILGTPNGKLLEKLKNKNCTCFPEISGTGLQCLLGDFSEHAKRLLKLMLEYDPDKRINARRLLQSVYFDSIRFCEDRSEHLPYLSKLKLEQTTKSPEGSRLYLRNKPAVQEKRSSNSYSLNRQPKKEQVRPRESGSSKTSTLKSSKTLLDVTSTLSGNRKSSRSKGTEVQEAKPSKTWNPKPPLFIPVRDKSKTRKPSGDKFRKTTSNLAQFAHAPLLTQKEIAENKSFQSKSFVQPLRKSSRKSSQADEKLNKNLDKLKRTT
ncbi:MAPK/MAK/MRK overlapping kinase-like isoform X2 [Coccinella septempunctata]|uniref:MAPK/MAK/MRK overlapping kinase-like isoform X2 n=1 Tax=Coccinella septempunctata TaxID=41139 RepID=UPI001D08B86E|nr:MAPK/MAK/MRK overlapping kinase-like isoform X2 [Coccinella septempunctata]